MKAYSLADERAAINVDSWVDQKVGMW